MSLAFTFVDLLTVAIVVVSMILAIWRGFISETLSIFGWAAAAFASLYLGSWVAQILSHMISPWWLAFLSGYALVFLAVLIPISFASFRLSEGVKKSAVGPLDRSLGALFGTVRGLAVVGALYLLFTVFVPTRDQPKPLHDARLLPLIQSSAEALIALAPSDEREAAEQRLKARVAASQAAPAEPVSTTTEAGTRKHSRKAYGAQDRRALDRLIEATGSSETKQ